MWERLMKVIKDWLARFKLQKGGGALTMDVYRDEQGLHRWRIHRGGRIVAESGEGYARRSGAVYALNSLVDGIRKAK